jgi:ATP-binding cassette subfamily B (MDR/TAP) protein 1
MFIKKFTIEEFKSYGMAGRIAQECLSSIRTVLALGIQKKSINGYEKNLKSAETMAKKKGLSTGFFSGLQNSLFNLCFGIGIYYAAELVRSDCENYSVSKVMPAFFTMVTSAFSLGQALPFLKDLAEARGAAKLVFKVLQTKSDIDVFEQQKKKTPSQLKGDIVFKDVHFSYPKRLDAKILKGLDLNIPAGKTIALVGSRLVFL